MSVQAEVGRTGAAAGGATRSRRALIALQRAGVWLMQETVDEPSARQRAFVAREVLLSPSHWR